MSEISATPIYDQMIKDHGLPHDETRRRRLFLSREDPLLQPNRFEETLELDKPAVHRQSTVDSYGRNE